MDDYRPDNRDLVKFSKLVARPSDILFSARDNVSQHFLEYRRQLLKGEIYHWAELHSPGAELSENKDLAYLEGLEPTAWKEQDHYAVLGLGHLRIRASDDDIRKAYRQRCLRHHPDKRMGAGKVINPDGDYFACIVKAFDVLGNTPKRRSYDSVDPKFEDYIPLRNMADSNQFFRIYGYWFSLNSRWSNREPVPLLGNISTPRQDVDAFYSFWYNFDSWREYSYLDEEEKEKGSDREERRWIDKQNKAARAKLKKEEMARIRQVVDNAYNADPRIAHFKQEDLRKKMAYKEAKRNVFKQKQLEEQTARIEAEEKAKAEREQTEAENKERELKLKKEKEAMKKSLKKERKTLRIVCNKNDYYARNDRTTLENMTHMEHLCEILPLSDLEMLNEQLTKLDANAGKEVFNDHVQRIIKKIEVEKAESTKPISIIRNGHGDHVLNGNNLEEWDHEELSLLIKAVNLFPAGTIQRWEVVANFLYQHSQNGRDGRKRTSKEVLAKAKDLKTSDFSKNTLKKETNEQAFNIFQKNVKAVPSQSDLTQRDDVNKKAEGDVKQAITETVTQNGLKATESPKEWTSDEQRVLEQALKTYTSADPDRWTHIAACVPGRSKKECMSRFKELAAIVKAKKSAQKLDGKP